MIENIEIWEAFKRDLIRNTPPDYAKNAAIVEALLEEARLLGVWPPDDPLEGIEVDIRLARIINSVHSTPD